MSDMQQTIGIVIKADGTVELANGMKLTGAQIKGVAGRLDQLGTELEKTEKGQKSTAAAAGDMAGKMGEAGKAAAQAASDLKNGDFAGAASQVQQVAAAAGSMGISMNVGLAAIGGVVLGVGALAFAASQGNKEQRALNDSLILTGNFAGLVTGQIDTMARSVATGINGTVGSSREVLAGLTATGQFTAQSMGEVATAVQLVARFSGQTNDQVLKHFSSMSDGVAKWAEKTNESYHFLDLATYQYIKQLEEQGNKQEAMRVGSSALSNQLGNDLTKNLGFAERAWNALGRAASAAWTAMKDAGKTDGIAQQISEAETYLAKLRSGAGASSASGQQRIGEWESRVAKLKSELTQETESRSAASDRAQAQQRGIVASKELEAQRASLLKGEAKITSELDKQRERIAAIRAADPNSKLLDPKLIAADEAAIRERYKEKSGPKPKAYTDDAATRYLQNLRDQNAAVLAQLVSSEKLTGAQKEQAEFTQKIADLKEKKILTAEQKSLLADADRINLQLRENVLSEKLLAIKTEEAKKDEEKAKHMQEYLAGAAALRETMNSTARGRSEQYDRSLAVVGMGSEARERSDSQNAIYRQYLDFERSANKRAGEKKTLGSDEYKAEVADIRASLDSALRDNERYYDTLKLKQADWSNGASEAFANYVSSAQNVAAQTKDLFSNAFKGMEDALVSFVTTGKGDFKGLANSIISDLVRIQVRAALTSAVGGGGGWLSTLFGGLTGGATGSGGAVNGSAVNSLAGGVFQAAKGAVFQSPSLSAYSGQIHSSPQFFAFAKGAGVFGEAGPEAIMPLARGPGGVLGVRSSGDGSTELDVEVHVHNSGAPANATVQKSQTPSGGLRLDILLEQITEAQGADIAAGSGPLYQGMKQRFGLRDSIS